MNKKILITLLLGLFLFSFASAESIGTFEIGKEMQITNYCQSGTCTFINLTSLEYPNGTIVYPNTNMIKNGQAYSYPFTPLQNGEYTFITCGDSSGIVCDRDTFEVNISGELISQSKTLIYLGLLLILLVVLLFLAFIIFKTENFGIKMGLTSFAYIVANVFLLVCWKISEIFLTAIPFLEVAFRVLYTVSNIGYLPAFIGVFVASLIHMTNEKNINTLMDRGYSEDRAISMTKRK